MIRLRIDSVVCDLHNLQNKWVRVQKNEKVRFWEN